MKTTTKKMLLIHLVLLSLTGCETIAYIQSRVVPATRESPQKMIQDNKIASAWQTNLPHGGQLNNLQQFWAQYDDPLLLELITVAQKESATIAAANTRIAEARATRVETNANVLPMLDANGSATRAKQAGFGFGGGGGQANAGAGTSSGSLTNTYTGELKASWEIDILGANKVLMAAAERREKASQSAWHDARVSVAAEVATAYFNQRFCGLQAELYASDAQSKNETARLTEISYQAGFSAKGALDLAQASAADAAQQLNAQQAQCEVGIKELVALTNWDEAHVRGQLAASPFKLDSKQDLFAITEIPATVIAQRPDIDNAEADLISAVADIKSAQVARLPQITLNGSIGWQRLSATSFTSNGEVWSLGPLSITLPLFDGGKRKAKLDAAEIKYDEQAANYRSKVRVAVKEVESALVNLHSTQSRANDVAAAIQAYQAAFTAMEHQYKAGFASLIDLEQTRRNALQAQIMQLNVWQARNNAWVQLYRAAGGGWQGAQVPTAKQ
jgi:multidrug efflux system outer membrane protein